MFFVLSKVLSIFIKPFFWGLALLLWGLLSKNAARKKKLLIAALSVFILFGNKVLFNACAGAWEGAYRMPAEDSAAKWGTAIVLGGYSSFDEPRNRMQLNEAADRFVYGLQLLQSGKCEHLLLTGGSAALFKKGSSESLGSSRFLAKFPSLKGHVSHEDSSRNTAENAGFSAALIRRDSLKGPFVLITSAFHMKRAKACFEKAGIPVTPYPVHFLSESANGFAWYEYIAPDPNTLYHWEFLIKEWIGMLAYKIKGSV